MSGLAPVWVETDHVLAIHARLIAVHGGRPGLRDVNLLHSALARPRSVSFYRENADPIDLAAAYTGGIVKDHPFVDGNKRAGFVVGILFLELNGFRFTATQDAAAATVLALTAGAIDERAYAAFLRANVAGPES